MCYSLNDHNSTGVLFPSPCCRNGNRNREIKELVKGHGPSKRQHWNLILGSAGYAADLLRKNNGKCFQRARHCWQNLTYIRTSGLHENSARYAHFLHAPQATYSGLPYSALLLKSLIFGTEHFALWSLVMFGQWQFPAWGQKRGAKWCHGTYYSTSLSPSDCGLAASFSQKP